MYINYCQKCVLDKDENNFFRTDTTEGNKYLIRDKSIHLICITCSANPYYSNLLLSHNIFMWIPHILYLSLNIISFMIIFIVIDNLIYLTSHYPASINCQIKIEKHELCINASVHVYVSNCI